MKLQRQALENLVESFNEFSISNLVRGWGDESKFNSTSSASRIDFHESAHKLSCKLDYHPSRFPFELRNVTTIYQVALSRSQSDTDMIEDLDYYTDPDEDSTTTRIWTRRLLYQVRNRAW